MGTLFLSLDDRGAVFDVASGRRAATLPPFSASTFIDPSNTLILSRRVHPAPTQIQDIYTPPPGRTQEPIIRSVFLRAPPRPAQIQRVENSSGSLHPAWIAVQDAFLRAGSSVLFEYSTVTLHRPRSLSIDYRLRALDMQTGRDLWTRSLNSPPPVPFVDPQSDSLILGWPAQSEAAQAAAARDPRASQALKSALLTASDSFFEVLDGRSGKARGGVVVQFGVGPHSFESVFVAGDTLFAANDAIRVSVYSLADSRRIAQLTGSPVAASPASGLFAMGHGSGQLTIHDLKTAAQLDRQLLPEDPVYLQFSPDGSRLFVLTERQYVYVLDLSQIRTHSPANAAVP